MYGFGMSGFDRFMFGGGFSVISTLMFVLIFGVFIVLLVRGIGQWHKNNKSPRLTVEARVVTKRTERTMHHDANTHTHHHSTWYYVTFEVESGDRMEFSVSGSEYGMLVEGDSGRLHFQGTRYLSFERL